MTETDIRLVEDSVRTLAAAAGSVRLYPAGSPMTSAAVGRFVEAVRRATTVLGNFRITIDPQGLRFGAQGVAEGNATISGLAETLYAQRAGQLLVSPGVTAEETEAFLAVIDTDPVVVRDAGGVRSAVAAAGVTHISLAEIELRDDTVGATEGFFDPMAEPLPDIAAAVSEATGAWAEAASTGPAYDALAAMLGNVDPALLDEAQARMAKALLCMDEHSRIAILDQALRADTTGQPMAGTLAIVAKMPPAALARLLALFADGSGTRLAGALGAIHMPPEAAWALETLLASSEEAPGPDPSPFMDDIEDVSAAMAREDPGDAMARWRMVQAATPVDSASRALDTTLAVMATRPVPETVAAVGVALGTAAREGAWRTAARSATALDLVGRRHPALTPAVTSALAPLEDVETMRLACVAVATNMGADGASASRTGSTPAAGAAEVLGLGGRAAAEALATTYAATPDPTQRARLSAVAVRLSNPLAGYAARAIRDMPSATAISTIGLLSCAPSRGTAGAIGRALDHVDPVVRGTALRALCDSEEPEGRAAVIKAMDHWDPATRRVAAQELGGHRVEEAVEPLVKVLWKREMFERNYELRKQCIESLVEIGSPRALPGLRRMAAWRFVIDRRGRELRFLAAQAVAELEADPRAQYEGKARP
jgi:hypothetical protein